MLFGYRVYDKLKNETVYDDYDEDEKWRAESKAGKLNALYN